MIDIKYTHFEGFGGAILNNLVGYVSNVFTEYTFGFFTDPIAVASGAILIGLVLFLYATLKGDLDSANKIIFGSNGFDNLLTRSLIVYLAFFVVLMPVPVAQMTPIVLYENSDAAVGVNRGDRAIAGWLVNDFKTTTDMTTPATGVNEKVLSVPLIFAPLGWIQDWYYGFPEFEVADIFEEVEDSNIKFSYKIPTLGSGAPTLRSCVSESSKLEGLEGELKARMDLGTLDSIDAACKTNLSPGGEWRTSVDDSIMVLFFGYQAPSEILSDYFEPIDRFFYYLSASPLNTVVQDFLKIQSFGLLAEAHGKNVEKLWGDNQVHFWEYAKSRLYDADVAIERSLLDTVARLEKIVELRAGKAFPKEIAQAIQQIIIDNEPIKLAWRRNLSISNADEMLAARKAIPKIVLGGLSAGSPAGKIQAAEKKILNENKESGVSMIEERHLEPLESLIDNDSNKVSMIRKIYDDAISVFDMRSPPHVVNGSFLTKKHSNGNDSVSKEVYLEGVTEDHFKTSSSPENFEAPATIQTATVSGDKTFGTSVYKNIYATIWGVERTLKSRQLMLDYANYLETYVNTLYTKINEVVQECEEKTGPGDSCMDKFKKSSSVALKWNVGSDSVEKIDLNMVYAGVYPSTIYLSASAEQRLPGDKTQSVLFLPIANLESHLGSDVSMSLASHQKPLERLNDLLPSFFWEKSAGDLNAHFKDNPEFRGQVGSVIGESLFTSFLNAKPGTLSGSVVVAEGDGMEVDYAAMNAKSAGLGDRLKQTLSPYQKSTTVGFENTSQDYSQLKDFVGRTMPSMIHGGLPAKFNAAVNSYVMAFSKHISSLDSQIKFSNSFYSLVDTMHSFADPVTGVFKEDYIPELEVVFGPAGYDVEKLKITTIEKVLIDYVIYEAGIRATSLDLYTQSIVDSDGVYTIYPSRLNEAQYVDKMYGDAHAAITASAGSSQYYDEFFSALGCAYDSSSASSQASSMSNCTERLKGDYTALTMKVPAERKGDDTPLSFPSSDSSGYGVVSAISRIMWAIVSYPLDFFRDYQNTAMVKVDEIQSHLGNAYRTPLYFGGVPSDVATHTLPEGGMTSKNKSFINPDFIPPNLSTAFDNLGVLDSLLAVAAGGATAAFLVWIKLGFIVTAVVGFVALLGFLTAKYLWYIMLFLVLAVVSGIYGFFKAAVLFPFSFVLWLLTYDFTNKESYPVLSRMVGENSNFNPKVQLIHAWKLLSIWILGFSMMMLILQIDSFFIEPMMQQLIMSNWVQSAAGDTFYWIGTSILIMVLAYIYILILMKGYGVLTDYLVRSYSEDSPEVKAMLSTQKKLKGIQDKVQTRVLSTMNKFTSSGDK